MDSDASCPICGAHVPAHEVGTRRAVGDVRAFAEQQGLDTGLLCRSCACGAVPSPCVSLCTLDDARTYCRGCGRTVEEITRWREMDTAERCKVRFRLRPIR